MSELWVELEINNRKIARKTQAHTCAVMGTASTMACTAETLGMSLPETAAIPAVHADRLRAAEAYLPCLYGTFAAEMVSGYDEYYQLSPQ